MLPFSICLAINELFTARTFFDLYSVTVLWNGQYREIDVAESETDPLIGMSLLYKYGLRIDAVEGGIVRVEAL